MIGLYVGAGLLTRARRGSMVAAEAMAATATTTRVSDFYLRLGDEPELLAEHIRDPEGTMAAAGLSSVQFRTVLAGDLEGVRSAVDEEFAADPVRRRQIVTPRMVIHTPQPEPEPEPEPPEPEPPKP
jgi:hypothetical protein